MLSLFSRTKYQESNEYYKYISWNFNQVRNCSIIHKKSKAKWTWDKKSDKKQKKETALPSSVNLGSIFASFSSEFATSFGLIYDCMHCSMRFRTCNESKKLLLASTCKYALFYEISQL